MTKAITIALVALVVSFFAAGAYQSYAQTASPTYDNSTPTPTSTVTQGVGGGGTVTSPTPTSSTQQGVGGAGTTTAPSTGFGQ